MSQLSRGQKVKLADLTSSLQLRIGLGATSPSLSFDISCFGIDANGQLSDDRYFVFYNQPTSPEGALRIIGAEESDVQTFELDLALLPTAIERLVFVLTIDGDGEMRQLQSGYLRLEAEGQEVARFAFAGSDFNGEKAVMVAEIYRKGEWRVAAVGQGFAGGLAAVLQHFGGEQVEGEVVPEPKETATLSAEPPKVVLTKRDASVKINLGKLVGEIIATARWIDNGDKSSDNDDLDLRAGILFPDGRMSFVTCDRPGSLSQKPFVFHTGDVREASRQQPGCETMKVNAQISQHYGGPIAIVFSVYSAVSNGVVSIASLHPQMKLQFGERVVECHLDFSKDPAARESNVYTYVIGLAILRGSDIEISPGGQVSEPDSEETPWLQWNEQGGVTLTMDGPAVFKDDFEESTDAGAEKQYV